MKQIQLTQGKIALVDDDTYLAIGHLKWYASFDGTKYYARRSPSNKTSIKGKMHHFVFGKPPEGFEVDHIDGNSLNNQRCNLRMVTKRINQLNRHSHRIGKLMGSTWHKASKRWQANITVNGKTNFLGTFKTEQEASNAYTDFIISHNLK